jgi:hypothetical protein
VTDATDLTFGALLPFGYGNSYTLITATTRREVMSINLPKPIAAYIVAENGNDMAAMALCFADDAIVRDEGQTIEGLPAIKKWKTETKTKYQHTVEPSPPLRTTARRS